MDTVDGLVDGDRMTTLIVTIEQHARNAHDCDIVGDDAGRDTWLDRIRELLNPGDVRPCDVCEICTGRDGCDGWQE